MNWNDDREVELISETKNSDLKILIVDDSTANIDLMVKMLEPEAYNLAIATDGAKALKLAAHFQPDLILLDVIMPRLDGFETCRRLQENEATKAIPIIFVTAKTGTDNLVAGFQRGGRDYITKPFQRDEVLARIRTHLRLRVLIRNQETLIAELKEALSQVKTLRGFLPICASCKKIRDDQGYWHQIETYIRDHSEADFSHGICMDCARRLYPDLI